MGVCGSKDFAADKPTPTYSSPDAPPSRKPAPVPLDSLAPPPLNSHLSVRSMSTVNTLASIEAEMDEMLQTSERAVELILAAQQSRAQVPVELRGSLCTLHGSANKMLATRIDAIMTGDLVSGKDEARASRKALVRQCEQLIERVEAQIKSVDALKSGSSASIGDGSKEADAGTDSARLFAATSAGIQVPAEDRA